MSVREITDEEAWEFALANEGLLNKLCRRFTNQGLPRGIDFEWLKSEGWEPLFNAAKKWDPEKAAFSTFAMFVMRNHLINQMRRHEAAQGGPRGHTKNGRIAWVGSIEGDVEHMRNQMDNGDGADFAPQYLGVEDPGYEALEDRDEGRLWLDRIEGPGFTELGRRVVHLRVYEGLEFQDIAEVLGTSTQNAFGVWRTAINRLRREAIASGLRAMPPT